MQKTCAILLLCLSPLCLMAKDHKWNKGILLSYGQNTFSTYSQTNGTGADREHMTYSVQIDAGDKIYFAERTLNWRWQKFPSVTENGLVSWELKGKDEMTILDDKGKEFTLTVVKSRLKTPFSR